MILINEPESGPISTDYHRIARTVSACRHRCSGRPDRDLGISHHDRIVARMNYRWPEEERDDA